jgi:hypothetical protein
VRFAGVINSEVAGSSRGSITNVVFNGDTFQAVDSTGRLDETFVNFTGGSVTFSVDGGSWNNKNEGFFHGLNTTCTVTDLGGYTGPASAC